MFLLFGGDQPGRLGSSAPEAEDDVALLVLRLEDVDLDVVPGRQLLVGISAKTELLARDDPLGLRSDVDEHLVGVNPYYHAVDDVSVLRSAERLLIGE